MAYQTVTLTGDYSLIDNTAASGTIEIIPSEKQIIDDTGDVILSGRIKVALVPRTRELLDEEGQPFTLVSGHFSVDLPATDDPSLTPSGFGYTVVAKMHHTHLPAVSFSLPAAVPTVDITDVTEADPSTFEPDHHYGTTEELEAYVASAQAAAVTAAASATSAAASAASAASTSDAAVAAFITDEGSDTFAALDAGGFGSAAMIVVGSGVIDLDDTEADGYLIGYRLTGTVLVEGVSFPAGSYIFERDSSVYGGWTYRALDTGALVVPPPVVTPTAPTFTDAPGTSSDTVTIPAMTGVIYRIGGVTIAAGTHTLASLGIANGAVVTVTAVAATGYTLTGTTEWSLDYSTAVGWTTLAADTFTAADATAIVGRVTPTGSKTYTNGASGTEVTIVSNAMKYSGAGYNRRIRLPLDTTYPQGVRVTATYTLTSSGSLGLWATVSTTPHASGITLGGAGATKTISAAGGIAPTGLAGTLTGHPLTGTLQVEWSASGLVVRIGGVQVATANLNAVSLRGDYIDLCLNEQTVTIDNLTVEVYT